MIAYFDCFSGISGDMILGALIDAGLPPQKLKSALSCLPIKGYKLSIKKVKRAGILATKVDVIQQSTVNSQQSTVRNWGDIEKIIKTSSLSKGIKQKGISIFKRLFEAEAKVHGERVDRTHLHELGAVDCLIDIFGTLIGMDILGIKKIYSSPVNLGSGTVIIGHGNLPVPAPATVELLKNVPVYCLDVGFELTTPTGAVLISSISDHFGSMPEMHISKIGMGAGRKDFKKKPNVVRVFVGQSPNDRLQDTEHRIETQNKVTVIETNIDDMNPQIYEHVADKLFKFGALDVFLTQVIMKKGRPGVKLTVLCDKAEREKLIKIMLTETTTIGIRFYESERRTLHRTIESIYTKFGKIKVKISRLGDEILKVTPEYEDCKRIAKKFNIPLIEVIKEVASRPTRG